MPNLNSGWTRWIPLIALAAIFLLVSCGNRVAPAPKPQPPPPFEFLGAWGDKGDAPGQLDAPVPPTTDTLGNIFFADPAAGFVDKFESNGTPLLSFQENSVRRASSIGVDAGGAIYLDNAQQGSILVFFPDGTFFQSWRGAADRHLGPLGFGIDEDGKIYLPDPEKSRILKLSNHGHLLKSWAAPQMPVSPDERPSWVFAEPDDVVFVAYASSGRIEKFTSDGAPLTAWPAASTPASAVNPISGFAATDKFVFTIAPSSGEIRVWTLDGQHKLDADLSSNLGKIVDPQIVATARGELLVFDPAVPKAFRFRMHLQDKESP